MKHAFIQQSMIDASNKHRFNTFCRVLEVSLKCRHRRRFMRTTDSSHALPIAPNLLEQRFDQAVAPKQISVTDIPYVPTDEGWLRPAGRKCAPPTAIKDLFTKKIVGWAMEDNMRTELVSKAVCMAVTQGRTKPGLLHHSDRGSQGGLRRGLWISCYCAPSTVARDHG